jgi:peptidyl-prolyl cis-trans isomerase SurA
VPPTACRLPPAACRFVFLFTACYSLLLAGSADRIVAVVGDQPILESQVVSGVEFLKLQTPLPESAQQDHSRDTTLRRQVLDQLINDQVILEEAKRETVSVAKEQVDEQLEVSLKNVKQRFGGGDSFQQALAHEGLTENLLRQRYREEITRRLTAQQLLSKRGLLENILVTPTEVEQFYATHKDSFGSVPGRVTLAHILIIPKPSEDAEKRGYEQIVQAYAGLVQSHWDFDALASSFTTDPELKRKSGSLGTVERGDLPEEVDAELFALKPGEFSKPFRSRQGYVIIKREKGGGDQATAREILVEVPITSDDTNRARDQAADLRRRALVGEDFAKLAKDNSDDPTTKDAGGMLGEFFLKGLVPLFAQAVENLKQDEISQPILSEHGFHIIKVTERVDEKTLSYSEMQDDIRNYLYNQKLQAKLDEFVRAQAARISIQRFP